MQKRFISLVVCTLVLSLSLSAVAVGTAVYADVAANHWAHDAIADLSTRGVVAGTGDNKFSPSVLYR